MRSFYIAYEKVQQAVGQFEKLPIFGIPWGHNILLLTKLNSNEERLWYAQQCLENGWSRNTLLGWIESELFERQGKTLHNFQVTLPKPQSDLVAKHLKIPISLSS